MSDEAEGKRKQAGAASSPAAKKSKGDDEEEPSVVDVAWYHYRSYLDSTEEEEDGGGDFDELLEVISLLEDVVPPKNNSSIVDDDFSSLKKCLEEDCSEKELSHRLRSFEELLPVLMSLCYLQLGSHAIDMAFASTEEEEKDETALNKSPEEYLMLSLKHFPSNAAAASMLANYIRMNSLAPSEDVCFLYENAAKNAHNVRSLAISLLEDETVVDDVKEWVELLLLNGVAGCEFEGEDDDGEDNEEEEEEEGGVVSDSEVEATASFMAALLLSVLGKHEEAAVYLKQFGVTQRIHPEVWRGVKTIHDSQPKLIDGADGLPIPTPASFRSVHAQGNSGVLPPKLYKGLCDVFQPSAVYWKESDYDHRGYYSYFLDLSDEMKISPSNVIEDVIVNHLLPLAKRGLSAEDGERIVGAEWWCHHRPISANLGHNLHFDTDESLLAEEQSITHPIISSVLYLTGGAHGEQSAASPGGSTIVFDQAPDAKTVAPKIWASQARNNSFMIFPGKLLHGVLPCPGDGTTDQSDAKMEHRLTFMVGFWTRRVPDKMKDRRLYGPCGPMPPATDEHTWMREIASGYENGAGGKSGRSSTPNQDDISSYEVPTISPAWETLEVAKVEKCEQEEEEQHLQMPPALDHKYFVRNAPKCFHDSLMNKDECF